MSKLTKRQRLAAYNRVLHELKTYTVAQLSYNGSSGVFVCNRLRQSFGKIDTERDFPEFFKQRPVCISRKAEQCGGWWAENNKASRIKALQRAIKLCEEAVK